MKVELIKYKITNQCTNVEKADNLHNFKIALSEVNHRFEKNKFTYEAVKVVDTKKYINVEKSYYGMYAGRPCIETEEVYRETGQTYVSLVREGVAGAIGCDKICITFLVYDKLDNVIDDNKGMFVSFIQHRKRVKALKIIETQLRLLDTTLNHKHGIQS